MVAAAVLLVGLIVAPFGGAPSPGAVLDETAPKAADPSPTTRMADPSKGTETVVPPQLPAQARASIERASVTTIAPRHTSTGDARVEQIEPWVVEPGFVLAVVEVVRREPAGGGGRMPTASHVEEQRERVAVTSVRSSDGSWASTVSGKSGDRLRSTVATSEGPDVGGDPDAGAIVAEGSVLLPGSFTGDPAVRDDATNCPGCVWRLDLACPTQDLCAGAFVGCDPMELRWIVWLLRPPATEFVVVGTLCRGPGEELVGVDALAERVSQRFVELLPRAEPTWQPAEGALVQIPVVFAAGEPASFGPVDLDVAGYAVRVSARAEWTWSFGDGASQVTSSPGGTWPDRSVAHVYGRAGTYDVTVTTRWAGEFTVNGDGPYPVAGGPIELTARLPVQVREAGAVLVTP